MTSSVADEGMRRNRGRPRAGPAYTKGEAIHLEELLIERGWTDEAFYDRFTKANPRETVSFGHFRKLITRKGQREPLQPSTRSAIARTFEYPAEIFDRFLKTGDFSILGNPVPADGALANGLTSFSKDTAPEVRAQNGSAGYVSHLKLLERKLGIRPGEHFKGLGKLARELQDKITIGEIMLEVPLRHYAGIPSENVIFSELSALEFPDYIQAVIPRIHEELKKKKEEDRPKIQLCNFTFKTDDHGDKLHLEFARSAWHHSIAVDETAERTRHELAERGQTARLPARLNVVAVIVSSDNKFVWVKRSPHTRYFSNMWGVPGEMYCPRRDIHDGRLDAASAVRRLLTEYDEVPIANAEDAFKKMEVRFTALSTYWRCFLQDLYVLVKLPRHSEEIIDSLKSSHTEHPEFATMHSFGLDECLTLLSQKEFSLEGQPGSRGEIGDFAKAVLLAALFSEYGYFDVIERLKTRGDVA